MPKPAPVKKRTIRKFRDYTGSHYNLHERSWGGHQPLLFMSTDGPCLDRKLALSIGQSMIEWAMREEP